MTAALLVTAFLAGMVVGMTIALVLFIVGIHPKVKQLSEDLETLAEHLPGGPDDAK